MLPRVYSKARKYQGYSMYKQRVLLLLGSSVHQEDADWCMFSFVKLLPSTAADPRESVLVIPHLQLQVSGREETSLRCTFIVAHNLCCSAKTLAVSKCIAHFLQKPAAIFLCRRQPFPDRHRKSELYFPVSARTGWMPPVEHVLVLDCLPSWLPKLRIGLFCQSTAVFFTSAEQESRSRQQCWALKHLLFCCLTHFEEASYWCSHFLHSAAKVWDHFKIGNDIFYLIDWSGIALSFQYSKDLLLIFYKSLYFFFSTHSKFFLSFVFLKVNQKIMWR